MAVIAKLSAVVYKGGGRREGWRDGGKETENHHHLCVDTIEN